MPSGSSVESVLSNLFNPAVNIAQEVLDERLGVGDIKHKRFPQTKEQKLALIDFLKKEDENDSIRLITWIIGKKDMGSEIKDYFLLNKSWEDVYNKYLSGIDELRISSILTAWVIFKNREKNGKS